MGMARPCGRLEGMELRLVQSQATFARSPVDPLAAADGGVKPLAVAP